MGASNSSSASSAPNSCGSVGNHTHCSAWPNQGSVSSGGAASGTASTNTGASVKKRVKRDLTSTATVNVGGSCDSNSRMGVEAATANHHHHHHHGHYFGGGNDCGSLKGKFVIF